MNVTSILAEIKNLVLYGGTDRVHYQKIQRKIENSNRITALLFSIVASILIAAMLCLSYFQEGFAGSKPVYIWGIIFSIIQIFVAVMSKKFSALTYVSVYLAISVFLLYGIAIATLTRPDEQTVTFMVMLIFVPLIFVDRPIRMALSLIAYIALFIVLAMHTKTGSVLSVDVTDAIIFGLLSLVSETVVNRVKIRGYVLENQLHLMSETDQLTGLNNRNCYEWRLDAYPSLYKQSICCIYMDVNGLHELNNTAGHKAGDEMLQYIAGIVIHKFGTTDSYRVGGDEFVAFSLDMSETDILDKIRDVQEQIGAKQYHAAIGYAYADTPMVDMNKLIIQAETQMYKDKSEYYKKHDRRSR